MRLFNFLGINVKKEKVDPIKAEEEDPLLKDSAAEEYVQPQENIKQTDHLPSKALVINNSFIINFSTRDNTHKRLTRQEINGKMTKSLSDLETTIPNSFLEKNLQTPLETHGESESKKDKSLLTAGLEKSKNILTTMNKSLNYVFEGSNEKSYPKNSHIRLPKKGDAGGVRLVKSLSDLKNTIPEDFLENSQNSNFKVPLSHIVAKDKTFLEAEKGESKSMLLDSNIEVKNENSFEEVNCGLKQVDVLYDKLVSETGFETKVQSDFIKKQVTELLYTYNTIKGNITTYNEVQSKLINSLSQGCYDILEGYVNDKNEVNNNISIDIMVAILKAPRDKQIAFEPNILVRWIDSKLNHFIETDGFLLEYKEVKTLQWIGKFLRASIQQFDSMKDASCMLSNDYYFSAYMRLHNIVKESVLTLILTKIYNDKQIDKIKPINLKLFLHEYLEPSTLSYLDDFSKGRLNLDNINIKDKYFNQAQRKAKKILAEYSDNYKSYIFYHEGLLTSASMLLSNKDLYDQQRERDSQKAKAKLNKNITKLKNKYGFDKATKSEISGNKDVSIKKVSEENFETKDISSNSSEQKDIEPFSKLLTLFMECDKEPKKQISFKNYKRKEKIELDDEPSLEPQEKKQKTVYNILENVVSKKRKASTDSDELNQSCAQERRESVDSSLSKKNHKTTADSANQSNSHTKGLNSEYSEKDGASSPPIFNFTFSEDSEKDEEIDSSKPISQLSKRNFSNEASIETCDRMDEKTDSKIPLYSSPQGNKAFMDHLKFLLNGITAAACEKDHKRIQEIADQSRDIIDSFKRDEGKYTEFLNNIPNHLNEMRLALLRGDFDRVKEIDDATRLALLCLDDKENNYIHTAIQSLAMPDEIIKAFENNKILITQQNSLGDTPVHTLVKHRNDDVFFEIVSNKDLSPTWNMANNAGQTPIEIAVLDGNFGFVSKMISCTNSPLDHKNDNGENLLHLILKRGVEATEYKHVYDIQTVAKDLIVAFRDKHYVNYLDQRDEEGNTPLKLAVKNNYLEVIEALVKAGVEKNLNLDEALDDSGENHPNNLHYLKKECNLEKPEFSEVKEWLKETVDKLIDKYHELYKEEGYLLLWITKILKYYVGIVGENQEITEPRDISDQKFYIDNLIKINNLVKLEANDACFHKHFYTNYGNVNKKVLFKEYEKISKTGVVTLINKYIDRINSTRDQENNFFNDLQKSYKKSFKYSLEKFHQKKYKQGAEYEKQREYEAGMKALKKKFGSYEKEANKPEPSFVIVPKNPFNDSRPSETVKPKILPAQQNLVEMGNQISLGNLAVVNTPQGDSFSVVVGPLPLSQALSSEKEIISKAIVNARRGGISDVSKLISSSLVSTVDSNAEEVIKGNEVSSNTSDQSLIGLHANLE
jgi:ankyrin repeat protein